MVTARVQVTGLAELRRDMKRAGEVEARGDLRDGLKAAAKVVADDARGRVPVVSGRARDSLRATAGGNKAYVVGGRSKVPYYGWLDFGTRSPRSGQPRSVGPWARSGSGPGHGRFIYAALDARERQVADLVEKALSDALDKLDL